MYKDLLTPKATLKFSFVSHIGQNVTSGHYTATTRKSIKDEWIVYDDDKVTKKMAPNGTSNAYILFYTAA